MTSAHILRGACSCERNRYIVRLAPSEDAQIDAEVVFDNSAVSRRAHASPLIAYLKVPIQSYESTTHAYYDDETHTSIRKTYHPFSNTRNQFCGYCGTQLSSWSGDTAHEAQWIFLTLGSLEDEDLAALDDLGLLPNIDTEDGESQQTVNEQAVRQGQTASAVSSERIPSSNPDSTSTTSSSTAMRHVLGRGAPWFETMVEDSAFGRVRRAKAGHTTSDGSTHVEYDVVETEEGVYVPSSSEHLGDMGEDASGSLRTTRQ